MTRYEKLLNSIVCESEIEYVPSDSISKPSLAISMDNQYGILFNESYFDTTAERRIALAHEKAHCDTGTLYPVYALKYERERCEAKAWRRTIHDVIPFDLLKDRMVDCVYADGLDTYELAEKLDVPHDFIMKAIEHYCNLGYKW